MFNLRKSDISENIKEEDFDGFLCWSQSHWSAVNDRKTEVIKSLSLYYYTFVDIMDFKVGQLSWKLLKGNFWEVDPHINK